MRAVWEVCHLNCGASETLNGEMVATSWPDHEVSAFLKVFVRLRPLIIVYIVPVQITNQP